MTGELRRADDERYGDLSRQVTDIARKLDELRDMLIGEPERSDLGRTLLKRAITNAENIEKISNRYEPMYDWWQQSRGAWRFVLGVGIVLGIIGSFFGLAAYFLR